jgi:hypothetical protein
VAQCCALLLGLLPEIKVPMPQYIFSMLKAGRASQATPAPAEPDFNVPTVCLRAGEKKPQHKLRFFCPADSGR